MLSPVPPRGLIHFLFGCLSNVPLNSLQSLPISSIALLKLLSFQPPGSTALLLHCPRSTPLSRSMTFGQYLSRLFCLESLSDFLSDSIIFHQYHSACFLTNLPSVPLVQPQPASHMFSTILPDSLLTINLYGVFWLTFPKPSIPYPIQLSWISLKLMVALVMLSAGSLGTSQTALSQYPLLLVHRPHFPSLAV